jgi:hypothetical protein
MSPELVDEARQLGRLGADEASEDLAAVRAGAEIAHGDGWYLVPRNALMEGVRHGA